MPTPIIPNVIRAQVVLQGASNLPEDRFVNTFHFETVDSVAPDATDFDAVQNRLNAFYGDPVAPATSSVSEFLSDSILRTAASHMRLYHLGDPEPRQPTLRSLNLDAAAGAANLPNELAVASSYYGGQNIAGRRGRIYVGPLRDLALSANVATQDRRVALAIRNVIKDAAERMAEADTVVRWVVLSQGRRELVDTPRGMRREGALIAPARWDVTGGWVDDAFDIQRRRGTDSTGRVTWLAV